MQQQHGSQAGRPKPAQSKPPLRVVESPQVRAARAEVAALREEWNRAKWLLTAEARLLREALAAAYNMTLAEWDAGGGSVRLYDPNQARDARGRFTYEGGPHSHEHEHVTVENASPAYRERIHQLVGRAVSDGELAHLAGAQSGDHVRVDRGMVVVRSADGSRAHNVAIVEGDSPGGGPHLLNWGMVNHEGKQIEFSPAVHATQVEGARRLGFAQIRAKARTGTHDKELLPDLGYNATIEQALHESKLAPRRTTTGDLVFPEARPLPPQASGARTLQELLSTPEGRAWWHEHGLNPELIYDLHA